MDTIDRMNGPSDAKDEKTLLGGLSFKPNPSNTSVKQMRMDANYSVSSVGDKDLKDSPNKKAYRQKYLVYS